MSTSRSINIWTYLSTGEKTRSTSFLENSFNELAPVDFHKIKSADHMHLAYELGKKAFLENPDCDAVYIGGGSWIAEPVAVQLEREFGKPVICNQAAVIRTALQMLNAWSPQAGHSRLLALP